MKPTFSMSARHFATAVSDYHVAMQERRDAKMRSGKNRRRHFAYVRHLLAQARWHMQEAARTA